MGLSYQSFYSQRRCISNWLRDHMDMQQWQNLFNTGNSGNCFTAGSVGCLPCNRSSKDDFNIWCSLSSVETTSFTVCYAPRWCVLTFWGPSISVRWFSAPAINTPPLIFFLSSSAHFLQTLLPPSVRARVRSNSGEELRRATPVESRRSWSRQCGNLSSCTAVVDSSCQVRALGSGTAPIRLSVLRAVLTDAFFPVIYFSALDL